MAAIELARETPFARHAAQLPREGSFGVTATALPIPGLVSVQARHGLEAGLRAAAQASFGLALPMGPAASKAAGLAAVGSGPGTWLVLSTEPADPDVVPRLDAALGDFAAVTDQSGAYAGLQLAGPRVADLLAKGALLDMSEEAFPPGGAATTQFAHLPVVVWRDPVEDHVVLLCFRSYANSLWGWLTQAAAPFGFGARG